MQSERLNTSINLGKQFNYKALNQTKNGVSAVRYKRTAETSNKLDESVMNKSTMLNATSIGSKGLVQSLTQQRVES